MHETACRSTLQPNVRPAQDVEFVLLSPARLSGSATLALHQATRAGIIPPGSVKGREPWVHWIRS